jgi:hypothetical protein
MNSREAQAQLFEKAIEELDEGKVLHERRDLFARNEDWTSVHGLSIGRSIEANMETLLRRVTRSDKYGTFGYMVDGYGVSVYYEDETVAGTGLQIPTGNRDVDRGRAALKAIFNAAIEDLRSGKEIIAPAFRGM